MKKQAIETTFIMSRAEYRAWAEAQPRGRTERVMGEVIVMAPERVEHVRIKTRVWLALDRAIRHAALPCEALGDGVTIEIGDKTDYEPDATVNCGELLSGEAIAASKPVMVVEVFSPSTKHIDTGIKLTDYFRVLSIQHYLILRADLQAVIHHGRRSDGIHTSLLREGLITLDPPGISISIDAIYEDTI